MKVSIKLRDDINDEVSRNIAKIVTIKCSEILAAVGVRYYEFQLSDEDDKKVVDFIKKPLVANEQNKDNGNINNNDSE